MKKTILFLLASMFSLVSFAETIELTFTSFTDDPLYYPEETYTGRNGQTITTGGDWIINVENEEARFTVDYYGATAESPAGTFTVADGNIDTDFSVGYYQNNRVNFASGKLVITETHPSAGLTRYELNATIVSTDNVTYVLHAIHDVVTALETVEGTITDATITHTATGFVLDAKSEELELDIHMAINSRYGVTGYYSNYYLDSLNTKMSHRGTEFIPSELIADITYEGALSSGQVGYAINMHFMTADLVQVSLTIEAPIVPTETVDVTCTNLVWETQAAAESPSVTMTASNDDYTIEGVISASTLQKGTYDESKAYVEIIDNATGNGISALTTQVTVDGNQIKGFTAEIELLGEDHKLYLLHLRYEKDATAVENIAATNTPKKVIENGQLVIIRDGVKYNATGVIM